MELHTEFIRDLSLALQPGPPLRELWITSAYASVHGAAALEELVRSSKEGHAILGYNTATEWQALKRFSDLGMDVQIMPDPPNGIFHPKCFFAHAEDGKAWAVTGSANLTQGGLRYNIEAGIKLTGPISGALRQVRQLFTDLADVAVPLTADLLAEIRAAQEEYKRVAAAAMAPHLELLPELDASQALQLTPVGKELAKSLQVRSFLGYISSTPMVASYKMVIVCLLLQSDEGQMRIQELSSCFSNFYRLLAEKGRAPERPGIGMRRVRELRPNEVTAYVTGAPREAFARSGLVVYTAGVVAISRAVWPLLSSQDRARARQLVVKRLRQYYTDYLAYQEDFSTLLTLARTTF